MSRGEDGSYNTYTDNHRDGRTYDHTTVIGGFSDFFMHGGAGLNMGHPSVGGGMFSAGASQHQVDGSQWYKSRSGDHYPPHVHQGKGGPRYNRDGDRINAKGDLIPGRLSQEKSDGGFPEGI